MTTYNYAMAQRWSLEGQPIREQIMAALLTRAQSYLSSATRDPIRRPDSELPRLVIADASEQRAGPTYQKHQLSLTVTAALSATFDPAADTLSHQAGLHVAGILAALCAGDRTLGGLCDGIEYESSVINYPAPGELVFGVSLTFTVRYSVATGDPFTR